MFKAKWLVAIRATSLCMVATLSGCGDSVDYTPSPPVSESAVVRAYESAVMCDALPTGDDRHKQEARPAVRTLREAQRFCRTRREQWIGRPR